MKVRRVKPHELSSVELDRWRGIQRQTAWLDTPFLAPEFTLAVARHRPDVEVAVLERDGEPVGFLPFQRQAGDVGQPVGHRVNDFQAGIFEPGLEVNLRAVLEPCGLRRLHFDHQIARQTCFEPYALLQSSSPYADFSGGFSDYVEQRDLKTRIQQARRKVRSMVRELGPVEFVLDVVDAHPLQRLIAWKSEQVESRWARNMLRCSWVVALMNDLLQVRTPTFGSLLSAVYAGDRPTAVHFGIRTERTFHWWFAAYDSTAGRFSPGNYLLLQLMEELAATGITRFDFGKGDEPYKTRMQSGSTTVAEGAVTKGAFSGAWQRAAYQLRAKSRTGMWRTPARMAKRVWESVSPATSR